MDDLDLTGLRTKAETAGSNLGNLQTNVPKMLSDLRSSLTSIYAKDNPLIQERGKALETFLSTPSTTRAQLLPQNLPQVEGSFLNLSPTQQAAIVSSRNAAALAPLLGLNQAVTAGYGNIGDIVGGAGTGLQALVDAQKQAAQNALQLYQLGIQETEARRKATSDQGLDLSGILSAILAGGQQPQPPASLGGNLDEWELIPGIGDQGINFRSAPLTAPTSSIPILSGIGDWLASLGGRGPEQVLEAPPPPDSLASRLAGYNFGNLNLNLGR